MTRFRVQRIMEASKKNNASPALPSLPIELITKILLRSPVKSIGRFRCVSKDFHSLLTETKFAKNHLDLTLGDNAIRSIERGLVLNSDSLISVDFDSLSDNGCEGIRSLNVVELDYPFKGEDFFSEKNVIGGGTLDLYFYCLKNLVNIVGSSNGLVCMYQKNGGAFLFNPTTGDSKRVPDLPVFEDAELTDFEQHGFGFDVLTDDYKLVRFVNRHREVDANVYSLKTDSWRRMDNLRYRHIYSASGVHLNGAMHWIVKLEDKRVIAVFDLKTEEFREILLPDAVEECNHMSMPLELDSLKGRLCVSYRCDVMHDAIWVMNENGVHSSWCRRVLIPYMYMNPFRSTKNDEEVLLRLESSFVLYNFQSKTLRSLGTSELKPGDGVFGGHTYVESLISPNSYGIGN